MAVKQKGLFQGSIEWQTDSVSAALLSVCESSVRNTWYDSLMNAPTTVAALSRLSDKGFDCLPVRVGARLSLHVQTQWRSCVAVVATTGRWAERLHLRWDLLPTDMLKTFSLLSQFRTQVEDLKVNLNIWHETVLKMEVKRTESARLKDLHQAKKASKLFAFDAPTDLH